MDIYYDSNYSNAYLINNDENYQLKEITIIKPYGQLFYPFILRTIPSVFGEKYKSYTDIISPYGYSGPLLVNIDNDFKDTMNKEFNSVMIKFCEENNVVTEFVRFHPIYKNYYDFNELYGLSAPHKTIAIDLSVSDILLDEFSSMKIRNVKSAINKGIEVIITDNSNDIMDFINLYGLTMDKNHATKEYYFPESYFYYLFNNLNDKIKLFIAKHDNINIAGAIILIGDDIIHYHLGATNPDYYAYNAISLIFLEVSKWGKSNGYKYLHLGGGMTNSKNDSLYSFKSNFTKTGYFNFVTGNRIWNKNIMLELNKKADIIRGSTIEEGYFPEYRCLQQ